MSAVLRRGPFARYLGGETISMLGTWMQQMAQGWVMAGLTTSAFKLGLVNFASGIPMLALAMVGGMAADRFDKRRILLATLTAQMLLAVTIGWLVASGQIAIWHIVVAGICLGIATAFEMPAASALVPELVEREQMAAAIAVDRSIFHATRLAGPAIGGWLIATFGIAAAFYVNAASFSALMLALVSLHPRPLGSAADEARRRTGMKEGILHIRQDRPTLAMLALLAISTLCISPFFMIMMPHYSMHVLHLPPQQHGLLMGSSGLGAFLGSIGLLSIHPQRRTAWLRGATALIAVAMTGVGLATHLATAIPAMITLTLGTSTVFGLANTIVQERAPDALRGRVSSLAGLAFFGVLPFSGLLTSKIADLVGLRTAMVGSALLYGVATALVLHWHRACCAAQPSVTRAIEIPVEI